MSRAARPRSASVVLGKVLAGALTALAIGACGAPTAVVAPVRSVDAGVTAAPADASSQVPVAVRIPRLGVSSPLVPLSVDGAGVLEPPSTADVAGWHVGGAVPGEVGPAVVAGHVDSTSGPGVFVDVATLRTGDRIEIAQAGGDVLGFTVQTVETVDKSTFPTERVYGPTPSPQLRLITCGGWFDSTVGHYVANVIVHAALDGPTEAAGWRF